MSSISKPLYVYLNDQFLPSENAFLHIDDLAILRGYGVFDFFRIHHGKPLFLKDYLQRFYTSAKLMQLPVPLSESELRQVIEQLSQLNGLESAGVKMVLTGGYSPNGYDLAKPNFFITQQPLTMPTMEQVERGMKIITHDYVRELPEAKTINYTTGIRLIQQVREQGADDILYHRNGIVTEFPRSNFFIVKQDDTIVTPAKNVLLGVTRKNMLEIARKKYKVLEGEVTLQDIAEAKEAFMTSTTKRIMPIVQVDGKLVGEGKQGAIKLELLQDLLAIKYTETTV